MLLLKELTYRNSEREHVCLSYVIVENKVYFTGLNTKNLLLLAREAVDAICEEAGVGWTEYTFYHLTTHTYSPKTVSPQGYRVEQLGVADDSWLRPIRTVARKSKRGIILEENGQRYPGLDPDVQAVFQHLINEDP